MINIDWCRTFMYLIRTQLLEAIILMEWTCPWEMIRLTPPTTPHPPPLPRFSLGNGRRRTTLRNCGRSLLCCFTGFFLGGGGFNVSTHIALVIVLSCLVWTHITLVICLSLYRLTTSCLPVNFRFCSTPPLLRRVARKRPLCNNQRFIFQLLKNQAGCLM